jgi:hypothetical protein
MTTTETLTTKQIETLRTEAARHGDHAQALICDRALQGDEAARAKCAKAIESAQAQA